MRVDPNVPYVKKDRSWRTQETTTSPLYQAIAMNNTEIALNLLQSVLSLF